MKREKYLSQLRASILQEKLILLLGARQVGKTTLMQHFRDEIKDTYQTFYINMEDYPEIWGMSSIKRIDWLQFQFGYDMSQEGVIFLDEIQVVDMPETFLKTLYDNPRVVSKIIATGSRFRGQKVVGSSLVGRGKQLRVHTFDIFEFFEAKGKQVNADTPYEWIADLIQEYLARGGYPAVIFAQTKEQKKEQFSRIIERLYEKDFVYSLKQSELPSTKQVFLWIAQNIGNIAKREHIANFSNTTVFKVKQILQFFKDTYLIEELYPYVLDKTKELSQKPKLYFHDIGIISYLQEGYDSSLSGKIVENFLYQQIISLTKPPRIHYYKTFQGGEVDFVVIQDKTIYWIESKAGDKLGIPKIMYHLPYDQDTHFIKTTKTLEQVIQRDIDCQLIPFWKIATVF